MVRALDDIDRRSTGRMSVRRYSAVSPAFPGFALAAVALWLTAGALAAVLLLATLST